MADWFWPVVVQGVVTAIAGVSVGWALLHINKKTQRKDAASIIQQRLESLGAILDVVIFEYEEVDAQENLEEPSSNIFDWVHEATTFAALLQDQQFAIFDQETRGELFFMRQRTLEQIALPEKGSPLLDELIKIGPAATQSEMKPLDDFMTEMTDKLEKYCEELGEFSIHLQQKFGATSYVASEREKDADE